VDSSLTGPSSSTPKKPGHSAKRPRRRLALGGVILGALLLTGCQLPSFGAYRGSTSQAQSTFKLWQGFFQYDNGVKIIGQTTDAPTMVVPTEETVRLYLRSYDVLHGFYVPEFNFSRYASPGYWTSFDLNVLHNGVYRGQCTQLCGLYHSLMFFNVRSVSAPAYQSWLRAEGTFQRNHPNSIGQLPAGVHPNVNGSVPSYSGNSSNTGNTGGAYYGD